MSWAYRAHGELFLLRHRYGGKLKSQSARCDPQSALTLARRALELADEDGPH